MSVSYLATSAEAVSRSPATGEVIERFPFQGAGEIEKLLTDTHAAFEIWRDMAISARVEIYTRFSAGLLSRKKEIASVVTAEMGKITKESVAEIEKCATTARWFAEHGPHLLADEPVTVDGGDRVYVSYLPMGVILGIMPWNFPLFQSIRACVPVLLSGNGFIVKPAPNTMRCAYLLQEVWEAAGLPKGLFAILNTDNTGVAGVLADRRVAISAATWQRTRFVPHSPTQSSVAAVPVGHPVAMQMVRFIMGSRTPNVSERVAFAHIWSAMPGGRYLVTQMVFTTCSTFGVSCAISAAVRLMSPALTGPER